jgi:TRAP-type C4-dicarboxylate transport system permease small subunit
MTALGAVNRLAARACEAIGAALLAFAALLVPTSVFFRYVLNRPIIWTEEVVQGLIAWMVFLGVSVVLRRDEHVRIEFVELRVSGVPRRIVYLAADVILLTFLIVASITSALLTISTFEREAMLAATGLPVGVIYASMPVGFGFSALNALERLLLRLSGRDLPQHSDRLVASTSQIAAAAEAGDETIVR